VKYFAAILLLGGAKSSTAQQPPKLTLQQAEMMALQNHPQIQAAQNEAAYANQQITIARAPYYPAVAGDVTGSQANNGARIGAGSLTDSRLFNRFGQGITFSQLITDIGRTSNLVASSRLQAQAGSQNVQATRYDVLLQVNRSYFDVLHAQSVVRVAQATIAARQLLLDQVTALAQNNLKSQLDVSFADVNVSEARLLLLRAQDAVEEAYAELSRGLGTDQVVNYQLADEPLPPSRETR
jgi:outer membrane protein